MSITDLRKDGNSKSINIEEIENVITEVFSHFFLQKISNFGGT